MFYNTKIVLVLFAVLLGQAFGCMQMSVAENWVTSAFDGWVSEGDAIVCRLSGKYEFWHTKFFDCAAGKAAFIKPAGNKLYFGNGVNHWTFDIPSPQQIRIETGIAGVQWNGKWNC